VAEVVAHLCEVEERRLHLLGGYASLFSYCVSRLGMSEDEAYRRIEVARLARRFPILFEKLASGRVSLSVAALLKPYLSGADHATLLEAVSGKTVGQAREVLAAWFPRPDVPPLIRKLPTRPPNASAASTTEAPSPARPAATQSDPVAPPPFTPAPPHAPAPPPGPASRSIEPLSPERYKVQLTANAELKRKIELARDLMRHAVPSGDLAAIVERAIDMLIQQTLKRRFGQAGPAASDAPAMPTEADAATAPRGAAEHVGPVAPSAELGPPSRGVSRHVPNEVRRSVLARDGVQCTWRGPDGVRCESRAWLEHDHVTPRALGGAHHAHNIRHLCRAHNQLAAELAFGRGHITRHIARQRAREPGRSRAP